MSLVESIQIPLGTPAPNFALTGIDGNTHTLDTYKDSKALIIIFMCNHCPYVHAIWDRLVELSNKYGIQGVQFIAINPNGANPDYPEDSLKKMKKYAKKYAMDFPYLLDKTQDVAKAYKAQCTPDIYVFNANKELSYHGRVDDNWQEAEKVTKHELDEAIEKIISEKPPVEVQKPSMGCSIKWLN